MKKILLSLFAALTILGTACKKTIETDVQPIEKTEKLYDVNFSVSDLNISTSVLKNGSGSISADSLKDHASMLFFRVYNTTTGALVTTIDQSRYSTGFGKIKSQLPQGSYTAIFAASNMSLYWNWSSNSLFSSTTFSFSSNEASDTFFKRIPFVVSKDPINQEVALNRVVAGLTIKLTDAIPAYVSRIVVTVANDAYYYSIDDDVKSGTTSRSSTFSLTAADIGVIGKSLNTYILGTATNTSVSFKAYDMNNAVVIEKNIPNVPFYINKKTTISGKLFSTITSAEVKVTVNAAWDTPPPAITF